MTGLRIALVGGRELPDADHARRALAALAPEAEVLDLPLGAAPTADLDGVWVLPAPPEAPTTVHDGTISWALHLGVPVIGPLAGDEGGARPASDFLTAAGTTWTSGDPAGPEGPRTITAGGSPFATLSVLPLATAQGIHPIAVGFVEAARRRAASRHPATGGSLAPFADDAPRSYVHQMRTGRHRWWRPVLALALGVTTWVVLAMAISIAWVILDPSMLESTDVEDIDMASPIAMLMSNLTLAALIPAVLVATRLGHWRPMGKIWSVVGRIRWGWLARVTLVTLPLWGGYLAAVWFLSGEQPTGRAEHWLPLVAIILVTTPLQSAGEEIAFRGALMQGVGAWIGRPVLALVVSTLLSAGLFALAHSSLDPWVLIDLAGMATACCYLTWRTGGLEAAIVLHAVNNVVIMVGLSLLGGLEDSFVTTETTSDPMTAGVSVAATWIMTAILLWLARRCGIAPKGWGRPALGPGSQHDETGLVTTTR